jgi:hypothetical protein
VDTIAFQAGQPALPTSPQSRKVRLTWQHQRTQFQGKDVLASGWPPRFAKLKIAY